VRRLVLFRAVALAGLLLAPPRAAMACEWSWIDQQWNRSEAGAWDPRIYRSLYAATIAADLGLGLWEGGHTRLGRTLWKTFDAQLVSAGTIELMKRAFARERPRHTGDPCRWFTHRSSSSFPSGEAANAMALVLPVVLEYADEEPLAYGALLLPVYMGVGRVKGQAHWQTDVLAGWLVGGAVGWWAHERDTPLLVEILPDGFSVGIKTRF
jgi:undecaprenyl-diphosphatase